MRLTPSERAIAVALDGDGARVALDPRRGGAEAVAQAALNVACSGAEPAAITNCLNFGNPERPGTAYALREAITGMAEACEVLGTPVVSGNVSLYNESGGRPIHPTPVVGCVGVLENASSAVPLAPADGSGTLFAARHGDAALRRLGVAGAGRRARPPGASPRSTSRRCAGSATCSPSSPATGVLRSAHDVSDGGLAVALAEIALAAGDRPRRHGRCRASGDAAATLFGECCGLVVVSCAPEDEAAAGRGVRRCRCAVRADRHPGRRERSRCAAATLALEVALEDARAAYEDTLPRAMAAG